MTQTQTPTPTRTRTQGKLERSTQTRTQTHKLSKLFDIPCVKSCVTIVILLRYSHLIGCLFEPNLNVLKSFSFNPLLFSTICSHLDYWLNLKTRMRSSLASSLQVRTVLRRHLRSRQDRQSAHAHTPCVGVCVTSVNQALFGGYGSDHPKYGTTKETF